MESESKFDGLVLRGKGDMPRYYSGDEIFSRKAKFYMIGGDRNAGKSTCVQRYCLKRAIRNLGKNKERFAFLVRYDKDCNGNTAKTYFDNTIEQWYPDYKITYKNRCYWLKKADDESKGNGELIGYCFAIKNASKMKSSSYPDINTIVLEEFLNIENEYIRSSINPELEVEMLLSLYSTIARGKGKQVRDDVRCIMVANCYYLNNPYFRYWNMIDMISKNPFKRFYEQKKHEVILEVTHNDVKMKAGRDDTHRGSKFIDMNNDLKIVKNPVVKKVYYQLSFDNRKYINVATYNDGVLIFTNGNKVRPKTMVFSCAEIKKKGIYHINTLRQGELSEGYRRLELAYNMNTLYYDSIETFIELTNILRWSPSTSHE